MTTTRPHRTDHEEAIRLKARSSESPEFIFLYWTTTIEKFTLVHLSDKNSTVSVGVFYWVAVLCQKMIIIIIICCLT